MKTSNSRRNFIGRIGLSSLIFGSGSVYAYKNNFSDQGRTVRIIVWDSYKYRIKPGAETIDTKAKNIGMNSEN